MKRALSLTTLQGKILCAMFLAFIAVNVASASGLSGKYTIDKAKAASSTNYTSFNDADSDLLYGSRSSGGSANGPGVTSAVIFDIADGLYNETVDITAIPGATATNTVTFRSASKDSTKVILMDSTIGTGSNTYVLHLDNVNYVKFYQLSIVKGYTSSVSGYSSDNVVMIDNVSDSDTIANCIIIGNRNTQPNNYGALIYSGYSSGYTIDQYNGMINNYMKDVYYGIFFLGSYVAGGAEIGNKFDNNTFDSCEYFSIYTQ